MNNEILRSVIFSQSNNHIEPAFIAAASELEEFNQYLDQFLSYIKALFKDQKQENRSISINALVSILKRAHLQNTKKDKSIIEEINRFLESCLIYEDFALRLSALEILEKFNDNLALIYILRNDQHSLVRKRAQDVWKSKISNTNKVLKTIYQDVLSYLKYDTSNAFVSCLHGAILEMATKYISCLEMYFLGDVDHRVAEFVLLEALRIEKMKDVAMEYIVEHFNVSIFLSLYNIYRAGRFAYISKNTEEIQNRGFLDHFSTENLIMACMSDSSCALDIYKYATTKSLGIGFIDFLADSQKLELLKSIGQTFSNLSEDIIYVLENISSSTEVEQLLLKMNPMLSFYYLRNRKIQDCNELDKIFERVFYSCENIESFIIPRNMKYMKYCSFRNIKDHKYLLVFLYFTMQSDDKVSFEKSVEAINYLLDNKMSFNISHNGFECLKEFIFQTCGYLLRNYLSLNRRDDTRITLSNFYKNYHNDMGYFAYIIESSKLINF